MYEFFPHSVVLAILVGMAITTSVDGFTPSRPAHRTGIVSTRKPNLSPKNSKTIAFLQNGGEYLNLIRGAKAGTRTTIDAHQFSHLGPSAVPSTVCAEEAINHADFSGRTPNMEQEASKAALDCIEVRRQFSNKLTNKKVRSTWARRLNTKQDAFSIHKICAMTFLPSCLVLVGAMFTHGMNNPVPESLHLANDAFILASVVMGISAVPMGLKYRAGDPLARTAMIVQAVSAIFTAIETEWVGPFMPTWMDEQWAHRLVLEPPCVLVVLAGFWALVESPALIKHRSRKAKSPLTELGFSFSVYFGALLPIGVGSFVFWFMENYNHDLYDQFFLKHCSLGLDGNYNIYNNTVLILLSVVMVPVFGTLRDRKLISAEMESAMLASFTGVILIALCNAAYFKVVPGVFAPFH